MTKYYFFECAEPGCEARRVPHVNNRKTADAIVRRDDWKQSKKLWYCPLHHPPQKRSKYGNKHTESDGFKFDSKAEERRYHELKLLERAGDITALKVHPVYELQPAFTDGQGVKHRAIAYEGDFQYGDLSGQWIVEDVKGVETDVFKIKRKLFLFKFPHVRLVIVEA